MSVSYLGNGGRSAVLGDGSLFVPRWAWLLCRCLRLKLLASVSFQIHGTSETLFEELHRGI